MPGEPTINPYNFVPISKDPVDRKSFPGWHRIGKKSSSGRLMCRLVALSPIFSADHQRMEPKSDTDPRDKFSFLQNSEKKAILQGTTLKGMVRAVYEAITDSCLPLAARSGILRRGREISPYVFASLGEHGHDRCNDMSALCPACRLFGVIQGDEVNAQGRVIFSDAILGEGDLKTVEIRLPELSFPKPYHYRIYSETGDESGPMAGRKFFYHHDPRKGVGATGEGTRWAKWIAGYAPAGTRFDFSVTFCNLSDKELALLVRSLMLDEGLGHKVGMAKPAGFGSCRIEIDVTRSFISLGESRYSSWSAAGDPIDVAALKEKAGPLPAPLVELLRLDKYKEGAIGYLSYGAYRNENVGINARGRYLSAKAGPVEEASPVPQPPLEKSVTLAKEEPTQKEIPKPERPKVKQGDKVQIEVIGIEGRTFKLRIIETEQDDFLFESDYMPWTLGTRKRVRVAAATAAGLVKKIIP